MRARTIRAVLAATLLLAPIAPAAMRSSSSAIDHARVKKIAEGVAAAAGATVDVKIQRGYPVTANDAALTARMLPTLERVAPGEVKVSGLITGAEDFTYFQRQAPGLFIFLGITPPEQAGKAPANYSPLFFVDEKALPVGVRALAHLEVDYLSGAR